MELKILEELNALRETRKAAIVVTDLSSGGSRIFKEGAEIEGPLSDPIRKAFLTGNSGIVAIEGSEFFLNAHIPSPRLVVIGAVHISQALAPISKIAGFDIEVIDPRTAFATPERFEHVDLYAEWPEETLSRKPLDAYCAMVAVTHDPKIDDIPLKLALEANCFYIGALGSRKTHAKRVDRLSETGVSADALAKIHAPIGLDIGAASPQEIAIAIMAEVVQTFRNRGRSG